MTGRTAPRPAALYARIFSDCQDVDLSVAAQLRALRAHRAQQLPRGARVRRPHCRRMSDLQFTSEVIGHLVWPVLVGFIVFLFKIPIATVIGSLRRLTYNRGEGFSAEFGSLLDELPYDDPPMTLEDDDESHLAEGSGSIEVSESDPSVAILASWARVERALLGVSSEYGIPHTSSFSQQKRHLLEIGVQDANLSSTLEDLRLVRSEVVHRPTVEPTRGDAQRYVSIASNVVGVLSRWAAARVPANFETDAPDVIEPLTETSITVTVVDAEGELVGAVPSPLQKSKVKA